MLDDSKMTRHRLSIPASDTTTLDFIKEQANLSASIRFLIREYVSKCGYTDPTCIRVEPPTPGRPKKGVFDDLGAKVAEERRDDSERGLNIDAKVKSVAKKDTKVITDETSKKAVAKQPVTEDAPDEPDVVTDDDGFVDPAALLGLG